MPTRRQIRRRAYIGRRSSKLTPILGCRRWHLATQAGKYSAGRRQSASLHQSCCPIFRISLRCTENRPEIFSIVRGLHNATRSRAYPISVIRIYAICGRHSVIAVLWPLSTTRRTHFGGLCVSSRLCTASLVVIYDRSSATNSSNHN